MPKKEKKPVSNNEDDELWELITQTFDSIERANEFLKQHNCRQKHTFKRDNNGFILSTTTKSSTVLSYDNVEKEISTWKKKSGFDLKPETTTASRMIVAYKEINDLTTDTYIVRIITKNKLNQDR